MTDVRIAIIAGSTRPGRHARAVADLADHPLPHLDEPRHRRTGSISTITPGRGRPRSRCTTVSSSSPRSTTTRRRVCVRTPSTTSTPNGRTRRPPSSPTVHLVVRARSSTCAQCVAHCTLRPSVSNCRSRCSPTSRSSPPSPQHQCMTTKVRRARKLGRRIEERPRLMSHHPGNATGRQQTPGRYRVADKVVSLPGTRDADLNSKGPHNKRPGPRLTRRH
jgi:hypothetical protein